MVKAHETGEQWKKFHCRWIETHRDGPAWRKVWYFVTALVEYTVLLPFYDIVHIHVGLRTSVDRKLIFAKLAKIAGKKIIIHFHPATEKHLFESKFSIKIHHMFMYSDKLIVLSPQWIKWIDEAYPNNKFDMLVVYNPCPIVKRVEFREKYILYAGTLNERKGYNRLLIAFAKIAKDYPDWKIIFAGNGEIENAKIIQKQLGIDDSQVNYLGWVTGEEKDEVFSHASIYCLPSWGEGFSMGVLDAIAYGVPVVTTNVGGITDIIKHGGSGLIFDTNNLDELSEDLEILMSSPKRRAEIISNADKLKDNQFNISNICNQLDKIYAKLS